MRKKTQLARKPSLRPLGVHAHWFAMPEASFPAFGIALGAFARGPGIAFWGGCDQVEAQGRNMADDPVIARLAGPVFFVIASGTETVPVCALKGLAAHAGPFRITAPLQNFSRGARLKAELRRHGLLPSETAITDFAMC